MSTSLEQVSEWVRLRRAGVSSQQIADMAGVSRQLVGARTAEFGPFPHPGRPDADTAAKWVEERRRGDSAKAIAARWQVPPHRVEAAVRGHGPYPAPKWPTPDGWAGLRGVAERLRVPDIRIYEMLDSGEFPPPGDVTSTGRRLWSLEVVDAWLEASDLQECPICGERARSIRRHHGRRHKGRRKPRA